MANVSSVDDRSLMETAQPRLAIVGCGAVVEQYYVPALRSLPWTPAVMVDRDLSRAELVGRGWQTAFATDHVDVIDSCDAAVVAVPNAYHTEVALDLIRSGKHVLVEKPLATTLSDCELLIREAEAHGVVLAVGLWRRFLESAMWIKGLLDSGDLGNDLHFEFSDGAIFSWPLASDSLWRKESVGGGVLMDLGVHTLDQVAWWFGDVAVRRYLDDAQGGVEADCHIEFQTTTGTSGIVELSRTRRLTNTVRITGSNGIIEANLWRNSVSASPRELLTVTYGGVNPLEFAKVAPTDMIAEQLVNWAECIADGSTPRVSGREGARSVALVEACYANRQQWDLPWLGGGMNGARKQDEVAQ